MYIAAQYTTTDICTRIQFGILHYEEAKKKEERKKFFFSFRSCVKKK